MSDVQADTRAEAVVEALYFLYAEGLDPDEFMLFPDEIGKNSGEGGVIQREDASCSYYEKNDAEMFVPMVIGVDETQEIKEKEESPTRRWMVSRRK